MKPLHSFLLVLLTAFLVTGCAASKNNGTLSRSGEVTKTFETAAVVPDHTYYYTGPEAQPDAIIGIQNSYTFQNAKNFWIKVDISEEVLHSWNVIIDNAHRFQYSYYGSRIMSPDGRQVGIWYSKYRYTVVKFPDPNTVVIYIPGLTPNDRLQPNPFSTRF